MIPQPLHPVVVHFPIVLVVLLPIVASIAIVTIRQGASARKTWLPVVGVALALAASSWVAVETGERDEEIVEEIVAESVIHDHEEGAEVFFTLTVGGLLFVSLGLLTGRPGRIMRSAAVIGSLGLAFAGYRVGHSGGALVYEHGAASAYSVTSAAPGLGDNDDREHE